MSQAGPLGRPTPRWSTAGHPAPATGTLSIAALPVPSEIVGVGPRLPLGAMPARALPRPPPPPAEFDATVLFSTEKAPAVLEIAPPPPAAPPLPPLPPGSLLLSPAPPLPPAP